jgi:fumarylacetoacetate (FAA) hydrolase
MFSPPGARLERGWPGRIDGDVVVQLAAQTLQSFFTGGGRAREHAVYPLADVELRPPVLHPPSVRVSEAGADGGPPAFSFRSASPVLGPDDDLSYPEGVRELDFGLGLAAVVGANGEIAGFTAANDWTARELERQERAVGLGPSKSKDFALSLGPILVTPDEPPPGDPLVARVNGVERRRERLEGPRGWDALVRHASRNTSLRPGDVLVRTVGGDPDGGRLRPGDLVELEVPGIGTLRNRVR